MHRFHLRGIDKETLPYLRCRIRGLAPIIWALSHMALPWHVALRNGSYARRMLGSGIVFRDIGQGMFQENACSGCFMLAAVALHSWPQAIMALAGNVIGNVTAVAAGYSRKDISRSVWIQRYARRNSRRYIFSVFGSVGRDACRRSRIVVVDCPVIFTAEKIAWTYGTVYHIRMGYDVCRTYRVSGHASSCRKFCRRYRRAVVAGRACSVVCYPECFSLSAYRAVRCVGQ